MKRTIILLCLLSIGLSLYSAPKIALIGFEADNHYWTARQAGLMTSLFRNELVRSGRLDVLDRDNIDKIMGELQFQRSEWFNADSVKRFGQMLGADYLLTGIIEVMGSQAYLAVQMTDIETSQIYHSSRLALASPDDFDIKVTRFAGEFVKKFPPENNFIGEWEGSTANHDFNIVFMHSNMCILTVKTVQDGSEIAEETSGSWSFDNNIIRINGSFPQSKMRNLKRLNWTSVYSFNNNDNTSFYMMITPPDSAKQIRTSFIRINRWD